MIMNVCAHTLVKNEARWLWYSVTSAIDFVDKVMLWDTGSSDGTLDIIRELQKKYPEKINFKKYPIQNADEFALIRQEMLLETKSDWILMLDGDEIWWRQSLKKIIDTLRKKGNDIESIYVPTINTIGDIFHYQENKAGNYNFGEKVGHYNLRVLSSRIPGLRSEGRHGIWGWVDSSGKMIQERKEKLAFVDAPYLHNTFLPRALNLKADNAVIKRKKKYKFELGEKFPFNFFYPESLFEDRPQMVPSPWNTRDAKYIIRATVETPLKKLKRRLSRSPVGY